jgi:hypothetical protein
MPSSVYSEVLHRAAAMLGGRQALRVWLRVSARDMDAWMDGAERPPVYVFLQAVDLVNGENEPAGSETLRRARELRHQAGVAKGAARSAKREARETFALATQLVERSRRLRAALLDNAPGHAARRRALSVNEFVSAEFSASDAGLIVDTALNALVNGTAASRASLQLACAQGLRIVGHLGFQQPFLDFFATIDHDLPSTCARAAELLQRVVVRDVASDDIFKGTEAAKVMAQAGARACQSTPLLDGSGEMIGMLSTHYEAPHEPSPDELEAIDLVCRRASYWLGGAKA